MAYIVRKVDAIDHAQGFCHSFSMVLSPVLVDVWNIFTGIASVASMSLGQYQMTLRANKRQIRRTFHTIHCRKSCIIFLCNWYVRHFDSECNVPFSAFTSCNISFNFDVNISRSKKGVIIQWQNQYIIHSRTCPCVYRFLPSSVDAKSHFQNQCSETKCRFITVTWQTRTRARMHILHSYRR